MSETDPRGPFSGHAVAYIWWRGDDERDRTEPVLEWREANPNDSRFVLTTRLWTGTFHSQADDEERAQRRRELAQAGRWASIINQHLRATHDFSAKDRRCLWCGTSEIGEAARA